MDQKVNAALIGFGLAGRAFHAPIITSVEGFCLSKIFTRNKDTQKTVERVYPNTEIVEDIDRIFNDNKIDLIIIATPNTMHFELAKRALLSNKHVVVEKPFTVTSKEADELITLAEIQGKIVTAYQNRRWDSDFKTVRKVIKSGVLGNLVEYEAHFDRFRNYVKENAWREEELPGSGILYDLGGHLIDQAQYLFGLPEEIYADIRTQRKGGKTDDNFEIILYYNELKVVLKSGMLVKEPLPHFILLGDKGSFIKYGMDVQEEDLKAGKIPSAAKNWGKEPKELWGSIQTEVNGLHIEGKVQSEVGDYRAFYQNVYEAITEDAVLKVTPQQARNTIKIIELAIESSKNKCAVKWDTTV